MAKPSLDRLWNAFPDHGRYPRLLDLYTMLGGVAERNINVQGFGPDGNTCASRLSVAFNGGGAPISYAVAKSVGARSVGAADGSRIIYRVVDFRNYLLRILGKPTVDNVTPFDSVFRGKKGIVAFGVQGWGDASGHIALFRNGAYRERQDNYATYVRAPVGDVPGAKTIRAEFWELG